MGQETRELLLRPEGNQKESAHEGPEAGKSSVHSAGRKAGMAGVKREEKLRAGEVES